MVGVVYMWWMRSFVRAGLLWVVVMVCRVDAAVLYQQTAGVLAFEAESDVVLTPGPTGSNFSVITSSSGVKVLPVGSNAVGGAIYAHRVATAENGYATYQLAFTSDGTYHLYARYSFFEVSTNTGYGNEDSYYSPTSWGQAPTMEGAWNNESLGTYDYHPLTKPNEGMVFLWDKGASTYVISGASEASPVVVDFTVRVREGGVALDRFVFTTTTYALTSNQSAALDEIVSVPEPGKAVLGLLGLLGICVRRRRGSPQV